MTTKKKEKPTPNGSMTVDGWASFLQGEIGRNENLRIGIVGMVLSIIAVMVSIALAFPNQVLLFYSAIVVLVFTFSGAYYVKRLSDTIKEMDVLLDDVLKEKLEKILERWLTLKKKNRIFIRS